MPQVFSETMSEFRLNEFHAVNAARLKCKAFQPEHSLMGLVACVQEEVGELAGAVLGVTGEKARKAHLTREDVLDAVADAMTYLSLVAWKVGCTDLEELLARTFNFVSDRAGCSHKISMPRAEDEVRQAEAANVSGAPLSAPSGPHMQRDGSSGHTASSSFTPQERGT